MLATLGWLGIPSAVICGHIARRWARKRPAEYCGAAFALSGLALGYLGIFAILGFFPVALARAKAKDDAGMCALHMQQLVLAFKT
jgi:hypothetical protein